VVAGSNPVAPAKESLVQNKKKKDEV